MKKLVTHKEPASVNIVWRWYKDAKDALSESKQNILKKLKKGKPLPQEYMFKSPKEVKKVFEQNYKELEYATILILISAIEAAFRIDHQIRLDGKKGDNISREFLRLWDKQRKKGEWTKFGDDILETWMKEAPNEECKKSVIWLKSLLPLRDWLAHGRCWERKSQKVNPETIMMVAESLMHNLPHDNFFGRQYLRT